MDVRKGIKRIFNLLNVLSGFWIGFGLVISNFHQLENQVYTNKISIETEVVFLTLYFLLGYGISFSVIKIFEKMVWYVWDGFSPKETTSEKVSSS